MRLKLDENLGRRGALALRAAGHEVATVADEHLCGVSDQGLIDACLAEGRCLVTLDLDFANPLRFESARLTPAGHGAFVRGMRAGFLIFAGLCVVGTFASLVRGRSGAAGQAR